MIWRFHIARFLLNASQLYPVCSLHLDKDQQIVYQ